jgi:hypothetical protein
LTYHCDDAAQKESEFRQRMARGGIGRSIPETRCARIFMNLFHHAPQLESRVKKERKKYAIWVDCQVKEGKVLSSGYLQSWQIFLLSRSLIYF